MRPSKIVHARDYRHRPVWLKGINRLWRLSFPIGTEVRLDKERLIREARRRTGLRDLGADFREEPLDMMLRSIEEEARLHPVGRFITRERLVNLLCIRLRAEDWFRRHPEILEQELYPVWLIAGLQRTGTTKLQRLLGGDPDNRLLLSWEALNPAPLSEERKEWKRRIRQAKLSEQALRLLSPGFFAIHPVEHLAPEEDVLLLDVSFMSTTLEATMHVPSYAAWLEQTDQSAAYAYMVKLLKFLQWQRPARRWVLKSPHHLEFLSLIERQFPKVNVIWPHRPVEECIPSFLSMVAYGRSIFSDEVSLEDVKNHWLRKAGYMLEHGLDFRQQAGAGRITDIHFRSFLADPVGTVERIYQSAGLPVSPDLRRRFTVAERANGVAHYGRHVYRMADFGLTPEELEQRLGRYMRFLAEG